MSRAEKDLPPIDTDAERALLGTMLLSVDAVDVATQKCGARDFYVPRNRAFFEAIVTLASRGDGVDPQSVLHEVQRAARNPIEDVDAYKTDLINLVTESPAVSHARRHAQIVADMGVLRRLDGVGHEIIAKARAWPVEVDDALDFAEGAVMGLRSPEEEELADVGDSLGSWWDDFDERQEGSGVPKVPLGWKNVDGALHGLHPGRLYVLAARPGMGKSSMVGALALNVTKAGTPALFASIEMSRNELLTRFLSTESQVSGDVLLKGTVPPKDMPRLMAATEALHKLPLTIMDNSGPTLLSLRAAARRVIKEHGSIGLIIVDYLQLMTSTLKTDNRQEKVADLARGLKILARDLNVPVVALSQLSRGVESRNDKRPSLADLRESGEIENAADVVMFIFRESYYWNDGRNDNTTELIIAKNRHGATETLRMAADLKIGRWTELAPERMAS